jgi:hypothetical protein
MSPSNSQDKICPNLWNTIVSMGCACGIGGYFIGGHLHRGCHASFVLRDQRIKQLAQQRSDAGIVDHCKPRSCQHHNVYAGQACALVAEYFPTKPLYTVSRNSVTNILFRDYQTKSGVLSVGNEA